MNNKDSMGFFSRLAATNPDARAVKITAVSDFTRQDADFILARATPATRILDLASGSGLIVNKIREHVAAITAVEAFPEFARFIDRAPNVEVVCQDILTFETEERYDLACLFGVVQYFSVEETLRLYASCLRHLVPGGRIIVKNQLGVTEDVLVAGRSEELGTEYFSHYRHLDREVAMLGSAGFQKVEVHDIYPPECNRWPNTHFYALVGSRP